MLTKMCAIDGKSVEVDVEGRASAIGTSSSGDVPANRRVVTIGQDGLVNNANRIVLRGGSIDESGGKRHEPGGSNEEG